MANIDDFMSSLTVSDQPKRKPWFGIVYGEPGLNKNGGCVYAPDPFLLGCDQNASWMPVQSFRKNDNELIIPHERFDKDGALVTPTAYDQFWAMLATLKKKKFRDSLPKPIGTIVIDNASKIQEYFHAQVVRDYPTFQTGKGDSKVTHHTKSIEDLGYDGRGFAKQHWGRFILTIQSFMNAGFNVILLAHEVDANYTDEGGNTFKVKSFGLVKYGEINIQEMLFQNADWCVRLKKNTTTKTIGSGTWARKIGVGGEEQETIIQCYSDTISKAKVNGIGMDEFPNSIGFQKYNRKEVWTIFFEMLNGDFSNKGQL